MRTQTEGGDVLAGVELEGLGCHCGGGGGGGEEKVTRLAREEGLYKSLFMWKSVDERQQLGDDGARGSSTEGRSWLQINNLLTPEKQSGWRIWERR